MSKLSWLSPKTKVKKSSIHGSGLFAKRPIRKGAVVAVKGGYIFDRKILDKIEDQVGPSYIQIEDNLFIGPRRRSEIKGCMIYSNHSCNPNIGVKGQLTFVAMRDIKAGEELTHDWAMTDNEQYRMKCNCGGKDCRGVITGKDWQKKNLQKKYSGYFSAYIAKKLSG